MHFLLPAVLFGLGTGSASRGVFKALGSLSQCFVHHPVVRSLCFSDC